MKDGRYTLAATTIEDYALFAGGQKDQSTRCNTVDVFHLENGEIKYETYSLELSQARAYLAATTIESYAIFAGGLDRVNTGFVVDIFKFDQEKNKIIRVNKNGTEIASDLANQSSGLALTEGKNTLAATAIGKYAIFAGGKLI